MIPDFAPSFVREKLSQVMQEFAKDFKDMCEDFKTYTPGQEMTHKMWERHQEFVNLLDQRTEGFLSQLLKQGADEGEIRLLLEQAAQQTDDGKKLIDNVLSYALDFEAFAAMLRDVYRDAHPIQHVCVLWDIENWGFEALQSGQLGPQLIEPLKGALDALDGVSRTAERRIYSFAPLHFWSRMPQPVANTLIDLRTRLMISKSDKEAADHELKAVASDYMKLLSPEKTAFVLISSDKDFIATIKECKEQGFETAVIHDAKRGSDHERLLGIYPHQVLRWRDFVEEPVEPVKPVKPVKPQPSSNAWGDLLTWRLQVRPTVFVTEESTKDGNLWVCELTIGNRPPLLLAQSTGFSQKQARNAAAGEALDLLSRLGLMRDGVSRNDVFGCLSRYLN